MGQRIIFNTDPPSVAVVFGVLEDCFYLMFSSDGTVATADARILTREQWREAREQELIRFEHEPEHPPAKKHSRSKTAVAPPTTATRPPWSK